MSNTSRIGGMLKGGALGAIGGLLLGPEGALIGGALGGIFGLVAPDTTNGAVDGMFSGGMKGAKWGAILLGLLAFGIALMSGAGIGGALMAGLAGAAVGGLAGGALGSALGGAGGGIGGLFSSGDDNQPQQARSRSRQVDQSESQNVSPPDTPGVFGSIMKGIGLG